MPIYQCKHFELDELVYPELYKAAGGAPSLWNSFDLNLRLAIDDIREFVGCAVKINDWNDGGQFKHSGLRPQWPEVKVEGALVSSHKFGRAVDAKFNSDKWNPEKLRKHMEMIGCFKPGFLKRTDSEAKPFINIRRIEWMPNMSWFHMDTFVESLDHDRILVFKG